MEAEEEDAGEAVRVRDSRSPMLAVPATSVRKHKGDPPEDHCYQRDIAAERLKLDKLEESKKKADAHSKERTEQ
eukprot:237421-Rhodomonas_salina.1